MPYASGGPSSGGAGGRDRTRRKCLVPARYLRLHVAKHVHQQLAHDLRRHRPPPASAPCSLDLACSAVSC